PARAADGSLSAAEIAEGGWRSSSHAPRCRPPRRPPGENAAAEEGALQRRVTVHAAAAESRNLSGGVKPLHRLTVGARHAAVEIVWQPIPAIAHSVAKASSQRSERFERGAPPPCTAWVLGVEGDYSWANITGSSASCGFAPMRQAQTGPFNWSGPYIGGKILSLKLTVSG